MPPSPSARCGVSWICSQPKFFPFKPNPTPRLFPLLRWKPFKWEQVGNVRVRGLIHPVALNPFPAAAGLLLGPSEVLLPAPPGIGISSPNAAVCLVFRGGTGVGAL